MPTAPTPEALPFRELTPDALQEKYEKEFTRHIDALGIPETHPKAAEELRLRTEMESLMDRSLLLTGMAGSGEQIAKNFATMHRLYEQRVAIRTEIIEEALRHDLGIGEDRKPGATLQREIGATFGSDAESPGRAAAGDALKALALRIDGGEDAFLRDGRMDAKGVAEALAKLEEMKRSPVITSDAQTESVERTEKALQRIADIDPEAVAYHRQKASYEKNPPASIEKRYARFFGLLFTTGMAVWAAVARNPTMAAAYGGIAAFLYRPDLLAGEDKKLMKDVEYLTAPTTMNLLARTSGGGSWSRAVEELFRIEEEGTEEQRKALKTVLKKERSVSVAQAAVIAGNEKSPLFQKLQAADSDEERFAILNTFAGRGSGERGKTTIEFLKARE